LAVFLTSTIGAVPSIVQATRGYSSSAMAVRTATIRTTTTMFVVSGLFNNLSI